MIDTSKWEPVSLSVFEKAKYIPVIDKAIDDFSKEMLGGASLLKTVIDFVISHEELEELVFALASSFKYKNQAIDVDRVCTGNYPLLVALVQKAFKHNFGSVYQLHTE